MGDRDRSRRRAHVTVPGIGRIEREPDIARASFTAEATRETAAEARREAALVADAVIAALLAAGAGRDDLRTASVEVSAAWDHRGDRPIRTGFTVTNRLGVAIRDLAAVGRVIDAALGAGATGLDGVSFGLADPAPAAVEARRLAVLDARARAETIAAAAGARIGRLAEVTEGEPGLPAPRPHARMVAAMSSEAATPVLLGRVEVTVAVVATWALR